MTIKNLFPSLKSRLGITSLPTISGETLAKRCGFATIRGDRQDTTSSPSTSADDIPSGSASIPLGHSLEEAEAQLFIAMLCVIIGVHFSAITVWLAYGGSLAAFAGAAVASWFWAAAWKHGKQANRLFIATYSNP
jgi:hypothetical protein